MNTRKGTIKVRLHKNDKSSCDCEDPNIDLNNEIKRLERKIERIEAAHQATAKSKQVFGPKAKRTITMLVCGECKEQINICSYCGDYINGCDNIVCVPPYGGMKHTRKHIHSYCYKGD